MQWRQSFTERLRGQQNGTSVARHNVMLSSKSISKSLLKFGWKIVRRYAPVNRAIIRCNLCLNEKLAIATHQGINILNKRSELVSKCRHFNKLLLMNFEDNIT